MMMQNISGDFDMETAPFFKLSHVFSYLIVFLKKILDIRSAIY